METVFWHSHCLPLHGEMPFYRRGWNGYWIPFLSSFDPMQTNLYHKHKWNMAYHCQGNHTTVLDFPCIIFEHLKTTIGRWCEDVASRIAWHMLSMLLIYDCFMLVENIDPKAFLRRRRRRGFSGKTFFILENKKPDCSSNWFSCDFP